MKKYIIAIIIALIYSFLSVNLLFAATFSLADITGTWVLHLLQTGSSSGWISVTATCDSYGNCTSNSCTDNTDGSNCPTGGTVISWTIDSNGVMYPSNTNASGNLKATMTSNKNFIAGTSDNGSTPSTSAVLWIMQKVVPGTTYSSADIQNKTFVYHQLIVGTSNGWEYGVGTTDSAGEVTISSKTDVFNGTTTWGDTGSSMSVDGNGVCTMSAYGGIFQGFLSDDKKTIVGTVTEPGNTTYRLMIIQITGTEFTVGAFPSGKLFSHMLGCGVTAGWVHSTVTVATGGGMTFSEWVTSNILFTAPSTYTGNITTTSGTLTITENPTYHGQISHDGNFTVGTQTVGTSPNFVYFLDVGITAEPDAIKSDFNADGKPDLVWQNTSTGQVYYWLMDGLTLSSSGYLYDGNAVGLEWQIAGVAEMNSDGKTDIIWRNTSTGQVYYWLMDGLTLSSSGYLYDGQSVDLQWQIAGIADMNSDGKTDLIWCNTSTGQLYYWLMDGLTLSSSGYLYDGQSVDLQWQIAGIADMNSDGKPDIIWRNTSTGQVYYWLMDGLTLSSSGYLYDGQAVDLQWQIAGIADMNNDGKADIIWRNISTGQIYYWLMDGLILSSSGYMYDGNPVGLEWQIRGGSASQSTGSWDSSKWDNAKWAP